MYKKAKIQVTVGATKEIWECQTYLRPRFHWCLTCLQNINHIFICKLTVSFFFQDSWQNHTSNLRFNLTSSLTHKLNKINKLKQNKDIISQRSKETQKVKQLTWSKEFLLVKKKGHIVFPLKHIYKHFLMKETLWMAQLKLTHMMKRFSPLIKALAQAKIHPLLLHVQGIDF